MRSIVLLALLSILEPVLGLSLMIPLYLYPGNNATAWSSVVEVVSQHPKVNFQIIINPNSGPGDTIYPDANFITGVSALNSYANVALFGYVDTAYTDRPTSDVNSDVETYAGWSSYKQANISLSGIFFDDVTNSDTSATYAYMANVSATAKSYLRSVIFNPGAVVNANYFRLADVIIQYEDSMARYTYPQTMAAMSKGMHKQISIIANHAKPTQSRINSLITNMMAGNIGSMYLTSDCCYQQVNGTLLTATANKIAALQRSK